MPRTAQACAPLFAGVRFSETLSIRALDSSPPPATASLPVLSGYAEAKRHCSRNKKVQTQPTHITPALPLPSPPPFFRYEVVPKKKDIVKDIGELIANRFTTTDLTRPLPPLQIGMRLCPRRKILSKTSESSSPTASPPLPAEGRGCSVALCIACQGASARGWPLL